MRKTLKNASKLIGTNLLVLFFLVNVVYWSIPTVGTISELYDSVRQERTPSAVSPSYAAADPRGCQSTVRISSHSSVYQLRRLASNAFRKQSTSRPYLQGA
jgi:hypothetical protein